MTSLLTFPLFPEKPFSVSFLILPYTRVNSDIYKTKGISMKNNCKQNITQSSCIRIVLTGGCAAGKSRLLNTLKRCVHPDIAFAAVPESATMHLCNGTADIQTDGIIGFQEKVLRQQLFLEEAADDKLYSAKSIYPKLLLCDRGLPDSGAYLTDTDFDTLLSRIGFTRKTALERYQGALFLDSMATLSDIPFHPTAGNMFRLENTSAEAGILNERTWRTWQKHTNIIRVPAMPTFSEKRYTAVQALNQMLAPWYPFPVFSSL